MHDININVTETGCQRSPLLIGYQGENEVTRVIVDYSAWTEEFGAGSLALEVMRSGDEIPYLAPLTIADGKAVWLVSNVDTGAEGVGAAGFVYTVGDQIKKSAVFRFFVGRDIGGDPGERPDPYEGVIAHIERLVKEAEAARNAAASSATDAAGSATTATQQAQAAATARAVAEAAKQEAETAQGAAETAQTAAEAARDAAASSATDAAGSATTATEQAQAAATARSAAEAAQQAAETAQGAAETAQNAAEAAKTAAASSAADAEAAKTAAETAQEKAEDAQAAAEAAKTAAQAAQTEAEYSRNDAVTAANTAGGYSSQARQAVNQAQSAMNAAQRAATAAEAAQTAAVAAKTATETARDTAITTLQTEGAAQRTAIQQKGAETLASIPEDYTDLSGDVADLKSAVDQKAPAIYGTASGAIASFDDGAEAMPVKHLTVNIEPVQAGSGDPSPDNVRPISGWTGCNVTRTGKNLLSKEPLRDALLKIPGARNIASARYVTYNAANTNALIDGIFKENTRYSFIFTAISAQSRVNLAWLYTDGTTSAFPNISNAKTTYVTVSNAGKTVESIVGLYQSGITILYYDTSGLFEGVLTTADFTPYAGIITSVAFPTEADTVYGGTLDVTSGVLTVTHKKQIFNGDEAWKLHGSIPNWFYVNDIFTDAVINNNASDLAISDSYTERAYNEVSSLSNGEFAYGIISSSSNRYRFVVKNTQFSTAQDFKNHLATTNFVVVYLLANSITYQLTPQEVITTLLGQNNIWADCGPVSVDYPADTKLFIQKVNKPTDDDMTADTQIASGKYFIVSNTLYLSTTIIPAGDTIIPGTNCVKTDFAAALNALNA